MLLRISVGSGFNAASAVAWSGRRPRAVQGATRRRSGAGNRVPRRLVAAAAIALCGVVAIAGAQDAPRPGCNTLAGCGERLPAPEHAPPVVAPMLLVAPRHDAPTAWRPASIFDLGGSTPHTLEIAVSPSFGTVEISDTQVRYRPPLNWQGSDSFAMRACNAESVCSPPATVSVAVRASNVAPTATGATITTAEDTPSDWLQAHDLVADPDTDEDCGIILLEHSDLGVADVDGCRLRFRPSRDLHGDTRVSYKACDAAGACSDPADIHVRVTPENDRPVLGPLDFRTKENVATPWVSIPVQDPDHGDVHAFSVQTTAAGGHAEVRGTELRFVPEAFWSGETAFTLQVCDGASLCASRDYTVRVEAVNDPPSVEDVAFVIDEDTASDHIALSIFDADVDDTHTLTLAVEPALGAVQVVAQPPGFVYTPHPDQHGSDRFVIGVCDREGLCDEADVAVDILPRNDAPSAIALTLRSKADQETPWVTPAVLDPDQDDMHTLEILSQPTDATVEIGSDGLSVRAIPRPGFAGNQTFRVRACDRAAACLEGDAQLHVVASVEMDSPSGAIRLPRVPGALQVSSRPLIDTATDTVITGTRDIRLEYSADAVAALEMDGSTLGRGESLVLTGYDFTATAGRVVLPLSLLDPRAAPTGRIGTLSVALPDLAITDVAADVVVWDPADALDMRAETVVARRVQPVSVRVDSADSDCEAPLVVWNDAQGFPYLDQQRSYCAVEWLALPNGLHQESSDPAPRLYGYVDDDAESVAIQWRAGIVTVTPHEGAVFVPATGSATIDIAVIEPAPPEIWFEQRSERERAAASDTPAGETPVGTAHVRAGYDGVELEITSPQGTARTVSGAGAQVNAVLYGRPAEQPLLQSQPYTVRASYVRDPRIAETATFTPNDTGPRRRLLIQLPEGLSDASDAALSGHLDAEDLLRGAWTVQAYELRRDRSEHPIGPSASVSRQTGLFTLDLGRLPPGAYRLRVVARPADPSGASQDPVATEVPLRVADASPIKVTLSGVQEQKIPFVAGIKATLADPARRPDLGAMIWEVSRDGTTFSVIDRPDSTAAVLSERVDTAGVRYYRATAVNRHTGERFVSAVHAVHAYRTPKFSVIGYRETIIDTPVQWRVFSESDAPIEYAWDIREARARSADPEVHRGETLWIPADRSGTRVIRVKARFLDAPRSEAAWSVAEATLKVSPPFLKPPVIAGPSKLEAGKTYAFSVDAAAMIHPRYRDKVSIRGIWRLPDGSTASAETIDYTAKSGDRELEYVAWVEGYEQATRIVSSKVIVVREYTWPTFVLYKRLLSQYQPTTVQYAIKTSSYSDTAALGREPLTYTIELPDGGAMDALRRNAATARFKDPGSYRVVATVSDTRGNRQVIEDLVTVEAPPPLLATLTTFVSDNWARVPLQLMLRWNANRLMPSERIDDLRIYLDGELFHQGAVGTIRKTITRPGAHAFRLEIITSEGRRAEAETTFEAIQGQPPSCGLSVTGDGARTLDAQATCLVGMGRVTSYQWSVKYADSAAAQDLGAKGRSIRLSAVALQRGIETISVVGIDDKGNRSPPATWTRQEQPDAAPADGA